MAKSTYISKYLTHEQMAFLRDLNDREILYFSLDNIETVLGKHYDNLQEIVENLNQKEFLHRIERSKYAIRQFADPYVLACYIAPGGAVAYWSALHLHGLTERFPNKIFVKLPRRKRPADIFGTTVQFITVKENKMIGMENRGYGDMRFLLTDLEMTLLDCFDQPRYAGDTADLLRAFFQAEPDSDKLIEYANIYKQAAVIKRLGYLAELYQKKTLSRFIDYALNYPVTAYSLFMPGYPDEGPYNAQWKLKLNMSEENLLSCAQESY